MQERAEVGGSLGTAKLHQADFTAFREMIRTATGIDLGEGKRPMVETRLHKRLKALNLRSYSEYREYLAGGSGEEFAKFVNALTTNKTSFFRESHHFPVLRDLLLRRAEARVPEVRIWCAASSTGQEPYSIAITALEALEGTGTAFKILATDIDTDVLSKASEGVYREGEMEGITEAHLRKYFLRGSGSRAGCYQAAERLRERIAFRRLNLIESVWPMKLGFDAIFCRNVIIYFDNPVKEQVVRHLVDNLKPDGLLFLGHSEAMPQLVRDLAPVGQTTYRRRGEVAR